VPEAYKEILKGFNTQDGSREVARGAICKISHFEKVGGGLKKIFQTRK
jgi:hypothetical protein